MTGSSQLKKDLFDEVHRTWYTVHPGTPKMYEDLKIHFWWNGMRREIVEYVAKFFTYRYQATIGMALYETLYGRPCRSPICWAEPDDSLLLRPKLVRQTTEKVTIIRERILAVQSYQKSYAD
ncbi:uncharacterized protein LOC109826569 [Asparagus officinalis]|uniref:uncharacterized protein LOC109826569 n=1 Tax=Asparagus officinalis TaxID=4686 RepID=UPI00098E8186|nr:uncharacterized protein LOC109826569 [Asparagus officinalis]